MISVLYTIILITNFKLIEMCIKSSSSWRGVGGEAAPYWGGVEGGAFYPASGPPPFFSFSFFSLPFSSSSFFLNDS